MGQEGGVVMKKIILFVFSLLLSSQLAWAGRVLPPDMRLAVLKKVNYPDIVLSGDGWTWTQILTLGLMQTPKGGVFVGCQIVFSRLFIILHAASDANAKRGAPLFCFCCRFSAMHGFESIFKIDIIGFKNLLVVQVNQLEFIIFCHCMFPFCPVY